MVIIGMGVLLGGYALGLWGWMLIQGYNVPFTGLWGAAWPSVQSTGTIAGTNPQTGITTT